MSEKDDAITMKEAHEELVQTLPDGYFSKQVDKQGFKLRSEHKALKKVKKHKRSKKGW